MGPAFPEELEYIWSAFLLLNQSRGQGFNGPLPISYQEIESWLKLTNNRLSSWEVAIIKKLDGVYLRVVSNQT